MADGSTIEWLRRPGTKPATWNPVRGCSRVSPGCGGPGNQGGCYAEVMAARFSEPGQWGHGFAETVKKPDGSSVRRWTGKVELIESMLDLPLRWRAPRTIFVNSTSDLFHEKLPNEAIDRIFAVMALCPQHTFIVLTKRPERMREYFRGPQLSARLADAIMSQHDCRVLTEGRREREFSPWRAGLAWDPGHGRKAWGVRRAVQGMTAEVSPWPLPNVWLGVSAEDQATWEERKEHLRDTPAAVRFASFEPLLGGIVDPHIGDDLNWAIVGGESGPNARPMHPAWVRSIRDQCQAAGVAFFHKQNGAYEVVYDRDRDDPDWRRCGDIERHTPTGRWLNLEGGHGFHGERVVRVVPVGKAAAGRLLDGQEWNQFPSIEERRP